MSEFTNQVTALGYAYISDSVITQTISSSATWIDMALSGSATESDITKNVRIGSIGTTLNEGKFELGTVGVYHFQLGFVFSGTASATYKIQALLNDAAIKQSLVEFTTRGNNVIWEVGMSFIVECGYKPTSTNTGLYSSKNDVQIQCQNVNGTGDLKLANGIYNVIKIN
tara:strand:- start:520 stop:1026 length:507 start_codon:yes stop_codon:yes gene_type:complete